MKTAPKGNRMILLLDKGGDEEYSVWLGRWIPDELPHETELYGPNVSIDTDREPFFFDSYEGYGKGHWLSYYPAIYSSYKTGDHYCTKPIVLSPVAWMEWTNTRLED